MHPAFWFSLAVFLLTAFLLLEVAIGAGRIGELADVAPDLPAPPPRVSVIVAALDEADTIEPALRSLLALDYPALEVIAVDDRSTDATPAILDRLAQEHPRLRVLHVNSLPAGWLGKNHALHLGAAQAGGDYFVFTDADVVFESSALRRAVAYCERGGIDHLALLFEMIAQSALLKMLLLSTMVGFLSRYKPWKVGSSDKHFIGVGAFNMLRRTAYLAAGGHAAIPLAVIDDMELGRLVKARGFRQQVLAARGLVRVEWYRNAREMVRGVEKNIFAAFDYQLRQLVLLTLLFLPLRIWSWAGLFLTHGATFWLNAATVGAGLLLFAAMLAITGWGWGWRCLLFAPVIGFVELAIWWRGCLLTLLRGGIVWRGTRYPLDVLRSAHKAC